MCGAVRTLLECIGEDPSRPGLLDSPSRYAKALLFLTKGYQQTPREIINEAIWDDEGHNHHGMVIVRDIEIYSLCEHHLVPFTGKVSLSSPRFTPCVSFWSSANSVRCTSATSPPPASSASPSLPA